jgi:hypothetical protein
MEEDSSFGRHVEGATRGGLLLCDIRTIPFTVTVNHRASRSMWSKGHCMKGAHFGDMESLVT